jgi:hypothetical protein
MLYIGYSVELRGIRTMTAGKGGGNKGASWEADARLDAKLDASWQVVDFI